MTPCRCRKAAAHPRETVELLVPLPTTRRNIGGPLGRTMALGTELIVRLAAGRGHARCVTRASVILGHL